MTKFLRFGLSAAAILVTGQAMAQITFYEGEGFRGRAFTSSRPVNNFDRVGFNDRASSVVVDRGRWQVCDDAGFSGHCVVLRQGSYSSLSGMGLNDRVSSMRPLSGRGDRGGDYVEAPPPMPAPDYAWRQRPNERVFEVPVKFARAVTGPPEQRCWVEREQVQQQDQPNVGRGLLGAVIGGVIGHQIGGGTGKDIATIGGAVAGGAIGANSGRGGSNDRDVQRCANTGNSGPPAYWDVSYDYRGVEHHVQMSAQPGRTIFVNGNGEPRQ